MRVDLTGRRVYLYRRVSSDEQARHGHSLGAQDDAQRAFVAHNRLTIVGAYSDEGFSGRSFDRPDYKRMQAEHTTGQADFLLVTKWSRFARNHTDAVAEIERWRRRGVEVQAIEQWINYADPNHLYQLVFNLVEPDVANRWLSINVRQGMRAALKAGRWVSAPPVGYVRVRDADDRPALAPDPIQAPLIAGAFALAADGALPLDEVYRRAKAQGLRVARSRFFVLLRQPAYVGRIVVPAVEGEPEVEVLARHEPIVDEATWARVQLRFAKPRTSGERKPNERFPLRGLLLCPTCALPQTSSVCGGREGKYGYYWCHRCEKARRPAHRHRDAAVHDAFAAHLASVAVPPSVAAVWRELVRETAKEGAAEGKRRAAEVRRQIAEEETRRARAEDLFIDGRLDRTALDRATARVDERLRALAAQLREAEASADVESAAHVQFALGVLTDLPALWARGDAEARRVLASTIWPAGVVFDGAGFGTSPASPVIALFDSVRAENDGRRPRGGSRRPVRYARVDSNHWPLVPETNALSN